MIYTAENILAVGIDPAKMKHSVVAVKFPDKVLFKADIPNTPEAIIKLDEEMTALSCREGLMLVYAPEDVTQYGNLLAKILTKRGRVIKHINPLKTSRQKVFYGDSKSDHVDARSAASVALREVENIAPPSKRNELIEALGSAVKLRNKLSSMHADLTNQFHHELYELWGCQYRDFFSQLNGTTAIEFWSKHPSPRHLKKLTVDRLKKFIYEKSRHSINLEESEKKARFILKVALEHLEVDCDMALNFKEKTVKSTIEMLLSIEKQLKNIEQDIKSLVPLTETHLETFPGVGEVRAAEILSIVKDINRFPDRDKFAKYNGTAPKEWSSGKSKKHYPGKSFCHALKGVIMDIAVTAARCDPISKDYFERQINRGKTKPQAYKLLARRISDILYAMMRDKSVYDPKRHRPQNPT